MIIRRFGNNYNIENLRTYHSPINNYAYRNIPGPQNSKYAAMPAHDYVEIIGQEQLLDESIFQSWDFEDMWIMTDCGPQLC